MAGYNRGIVATRKLNEKNKARLGRGGDTKIREVAGKDSHVNALEAFLIDVNGKAGEEYAQRVGAGTVNPLTGMPEYHGKWGWGKKKHPGHHTLLDLAESVVNPIAAYETYTGNETGLSTIGELAVDPSQKVADFDQISDNLGVDLVPEEDPGLFQGTGAGKKSYDELRAMTPEERAKYMETEFGIGAGYEQYMTGFQDKPFEFLKQQQDLTTRGLESAYGATMGALGSQQATLGRTTGRGISQATRTADIATSRSGLATSGTITQGLETQKKQLFQDYAAGMGDIGRQRGTALETLTLGKQGAGLGFREAEYAEKQRQEEQFYTDIGMIGSRV